MEEQLEAGKDVILEIEIQGALKVKEKYPETLLLFITPPNAKELERRLIGRGTETMEVIQSRMKRAAEEAEGMGAYDYIVVNDSLDICVEEIHNIIKSEHSRGFRNEDLITQIKEELEEKRKENKIMLHPSYTDLMKVVNQDVEEGATKIVNSRYSIVLATSKRARQIIDGDTPLVPTKDGENSLSIAIDELNNAKIKIIAEDSEQ